MRETDSARHGEVISYYVTPDACVVMTVSDPGESGTLTIFVPQAWLSAMARAEPRYDDGGPPQAATPRFEGE